MPTTKMIVPSTYHLFHMLTFTNTKSINTWRY